jgi:uncharacterized delta-60 repeat protein
MGRVSLCHVESLERRTLLAAVFASDITFGSGGLAATKTYAGTLAVLPDGTILGLGGQSESIDDDNEFFSSIVTLNPDGSLAGETGSDSLNSGNWIYGGSRYYLETFDNDATDGPMETDNIHAFGVDADKFGNFGREPVPTAVKYSDPYDTVGATFIKALPDGTLYLDVNHQFASDYSKQYHELTRLKPDGSVDKTFGDNGFVVFNPGDPAGDFSAYYTSKGLIRATNTGTQMRLTRYKSDGITIDTSFGSGGTVTLNNSQSGSFSEQADGRILYLTNEPGTNDLLKFRMSRLNADGSPDTSFGNGGSVDMQSPTDDVLRDSAVIELDPQQRIWVAAGTRLYRFNSNGALDAAPFDGSQYFDDLPFTVDSAGRLYAYKAYFGVQRFAAVDPIVLNGDRLSVTGTGDRDTVTIMQDAAGGIDATVAQISSAGVNDITVNPVTKHFNAGKVASIHVATGADWDTITNTSNIPSTIEAGDGDDSVYGGSAADRLDGGMGDDVLWGNDGNDRIAGDDGSDHLYGGGGNDKIYGGAQGDFIRGNAGRDVLYGNGGNDRIYGGASADRIYGQGGNDQLFGEGGDDRLYADYATGHSTLHGGAGDDTLISKNSLADQLFGDRGTDSAVADAEDVKTGVETAV